MSEPQPQEYQLEPTGELEPCPGEAHSNAHIDNCSLCAPLWGKRPAFYPVDLERAKRERLDVRASHLTDEQSDRMEEAEQRGEVELVGVRRKRKGNVSLYNVWRFKEAT